MSDNTHTQVLQAYAREQKHSSPLALPAESRLRLVIRRQHIEQHKEGAAASHELDPFPIWVFDMATIFVKCDPAVSGDSLSNAKDGHMNLGMLKGKIVDRAI